MNADLTDLLGSNMVIHVTGIPASCWWFRGSPETFNDFALHGYWRAL